MQLQSTLLTKSPLRWAWDIIESRFLIPSCEQLSSRTLLLLCAKWQILCSPSLKCSHLWWLCHNDCSWILYRKYHKLKCRLCSFRAFRWDIITVVDRMLQDALVPPAHVARLYDAAATSSLKHLYPVTNGTHNDTWQQAGAEYYQVRKKPPDGECNDFRKYLASSRVHWHSLLPQ